MHGLEHRVLGSGHFLVRMERLGAPPQRETFNPTINSDEMNKLTLEPEKHVYTVGKRVVPGVTSILQDNFGVKPYWSEWHAQKGTAVHQAIALLVKDELDWESVDHRITGRIKAFQRFIQETGYEVLWSEESLFSKRYQFAGTLDLVVFDGAADHILIDIKPPSAEPIVDLQLAGYSLLFDERGTQKTKRAACVCLKDNGYYSMKWVDNLVLSKRVFLACLTVSNWQKENC